MNDITDLLFLENFHHRQLEPVDAVPTPLPSLNRICRDDGGGEGLAAGWFVTLGGNPGHGKSIAALNFCAQASAHAESIGYVSLEMSAQQLAARFYAIRSGEPIAHLERGNFQEGTWERARAAVDILPPLYVPERVSGAWGEVMEFVRTCRGLGCRWFVVDYLQLIQIGAEEQLTRAISEITTELRAWAANTGSIVLALSQFNRQTSSEYSLRPRPQGLYGGMILEASSDLVLLLDHSRYKRDGNHARTWLLFPKNRHGPQGEIPILWDYRSLQMREGLEDELHEWPNTT